MFSLDRKTVKLVNVNPRAEKHGDENALACDLKFENPRQQRCSVRIPSFPEKRSLQGTGSGKSDR